MKKKLIRSGSVTSFIVAALFFVFSNTVAQTTPWKVTYYAFDHGGPKISTFSPDANVVILFEGQVWEFVDSIHYPFAQNKFLSANANYKSYASIINDVRILQAKGVKVLYNVDDAPSWQTATPFTNWAGTALTTTQYVDMIKRYVIDSLHLDGIALDVEHITPYSTVPTQNYLNILTGLAQYFGPTSSNPSTIYTIATGSDVYYGINPIQTIPSYAAALNFVMDMCYWNTNAQRISTRLPPYANSTNIGWPKTMAGVDVEQPYSASQFTQDSLSAIWQPSGSYKAGIMVYAGNSDTAKMGKIFRLLTNGSVPAKPVVGFTGNPVNILSGQTVTFSNTTTNATSYLWSFTGGAPSSSSATNPAVTYSTPGIYTVKLVASNSNGSDSLVRTSYINVSSSSSNNYALNFNGTSQYLTAGTINLSGSGVSMEGWIMPSAFKTTSPYISTIMGTESTGGTALLRMGDAGITGGNKLQFVLTFGSTQVKLTSAYAFTSGTWYHVAATYDGTTIKLYVNGNLDASLPQTGSFTSNGAFNIGYSYDQTRYWNGSMDELRVWKRALTQSEIQANMCSVPVNSNMLEAYWKLNEGSGTTAADVSGHGHTGTMMNMTASNWSTNVSSTCTSVPAPVANFSATPTNITNGQSVTFTNNSVNATSYSWTFTGGTPSVSTEINPVVTYSTAGTYTVKLVAINASGSDSIVKVGYIAVTNPASNYSISFNGSNQSINSGSINLSGSAVTMEGWIRANSFKTISPYISTVMGTESSGGTALLRMGDANIPGGNKLQFVLQIGTSQVKLVSNTVFTTGTWYHIAASYDGATMKLYVNGVLDVSQSQTGSFTSNGVFYMGYSYDINRYWNGNMDELRVWKRALTQAEIQSNMCTIPVNSTSLEGYWKMNEGTGNSTADATGHSHTGTMTNVTAASWSTTVPSTCGSTAARIAKPSTSSLIEVKASPNPVQLNNVITISVSKLVGNMTLSVVAADGREIMNKKLVIMNNSISTSGLATGVYFYVVRGDGGNIVGSGKIVIK